MQGLNLDHTYGASALSSFISAALFGFTFLQTYAYFVHSCGNDGLHLKLGVILLWALDGLQVMFLVWAVYHYLVQNFFFPASLGIEHWSIPVMWMMSLLGNFVTESYFVVHIWTLSRKNMAVASLITIAAVGQLISSIIVFHHMIVGLNSNIIATASGNMIPVALQQVCAIICNVSITGALCYFKHTSRDGLFGGVSTLDGILAVAIDRGLISAILQVVYLLVYVFHDKTFLWLPFHVASSKLLVNALLAQLNNRDIKTRRRESMGLTLSHLGARPIVPMNEQVMVVTTKTVLESDSNSISVSSKAPGDLEGQHE